MLDFRQRYNRHIQEIGGISNADYIETARRPLCAGPHPLRGRPVVPAVPLRRSLSVLAFVLGGAGVLMLAVQGDMFNGIALLVMGFALSPFGLPALAGWLLDRLDDLNCSLRSFITG